jgi:hypothetical protein
MVCDLLQKIELLHATGTLFTPPHAEAMIKTFYEILNVLDSKGLALLAFDGIVVAATTFAAEKGDVFHRRGLARWLAILIIVLSLTAAALCLFVSEISYPFFNFVGCSSAPDTLDFTNEITHLAGLVDWRSSCYRIAWTCSIVAIPLFLALFWVSLNWEKRPKS